MKMLASAAALATAMLLTAPAHAAAIISAKSVTALFGGQAGSSGSSSPWWVGNTINQTGLNKTYVSGVTDFATFIASNPRHNTGPYSEWNSDQNIFSARLLFDFGEDVTIDGLALWDENSSSLSSISLGTYDLGQFADFNVIDTPPGSSQSYGAQTFNFRKITTRYLVLDMHGCNQGGGFNHPGCGLGEIAFRQASSVTGAVPEPTTWAMMLLGFGALGATLRRRRSLGMAAAAA